MVPEACSGKEPAGSKAATGEAFTFNWAGPGGGPEEREPSAHLGLNPERSSLLAAGITGPGRGQAEETRR